MDTFQSEGALNQPTIAQTAPDPLSGQASGISGLPEKPLIVIEAAGTWAGMGFRDLWYYRELLYFLALRDVKVRYKQTLLGVLWVVMQPLLMTLIFTVFLGLLARVPANGKPYPLVVYTGLLPWTFFSSAVLGCTYSLVGNANLITKVYFPRILIPAASIAARLLDLAISCVILLGLLMYYRFVAHYPLTVSWRLAVLPLVMLVLVLFTLGLGLLVSAMNVKYRDVGVALPVLIQLLMFVSPVIYLTDLIPLNYRTYYFLNPLSGLIDSVRVTLLGGQFNTFSLVVSGVSTLLLLIFGAVVFRRAERNFADVI
jgi:lipopolysaccharide transport system permease protein